MFFAFFGGGWLFLGISQSGHGSLLLYALLLIAAATIFFLALRHYGANRSAREATEHTPEGKKRARQFNLINALQWTAIIITSITLSNMHHGNWAVPAIIFIVGLHFLPLARVFSYPPHLVTGIVLIAVAIAYPFVSPAGVNSVSGCIATGLVLWASALYGLSV